MTKRKQPSLFKPPDSIEETSPEFRLFYKAYPNKKAWRGAWDAWQNLNPGAELLGSILGSIEAQKREREVRIRAVLWNPEWPYPATWLNGKRWDDEIELPATKPTSGQRTMENLEKRRNIYTTIAGN